MDLESFIIGLISLALFIVPIMLIQRKQRQQKKKFLENFMNLAEQKQLKITEYDFWNHCFAIGIDKGQNKLFYLKKQNEGEQTALINLSEVAACRVINMNREVNGDRVIDFIELRFTFRNPGIPEQALEFYNKEKSLSLNEELLIAEKWKAIANTSLQPPQPYNTPTALKDDSLVLM